ncbi:MAG: AI-2E family transporter, partial [Gemmatimonadaceae bacterium]|nr:AI-2E family transporter [Gemmatimonadaceae bacterium]
AAMFREAQTECLRFFGLLTITNAFYGLCVGTALWLLGMPNPLLFGIGAMIVEFVPVLGMLTYMAVTAVVALGTFDTIGPVIGALVTVFLLNFVVMNLVAPLFVGKRMSVHPVLLVAAVFFWTWTWGIAGAFLATPLVLTGRILVRRLGWLGEVASPDAEDDPRTIREHGRAMRAELATRLRASRLAGVPHAVAHAIGGPTRKAE